MRLAGDVMTVVVERHGSDIADTSTGDVRVSSVALRDCQTALESCQDHEGWIQGFVVGVLTAFVVLLAIGLVERVVQRWQQRKAGR